MSRSAVSHLAVPTVVAGPELDWASLSKKTPEIKQGVFLDARKTSVDGAKEALKRAKDAGIFVVSVIGSHEGLGIPTIMASTKTPFNRVKNTDEEAEVSTKEKSTTVNKRMPTKIYDQRVRSGQQVLAPDSDLVVTGGVSQGAELRCDGSVHIYGPMFGRVYAGMNGDTSARVYCLAFNADLVSIAGQYQVFETIHPNLLGKPVMFWLQDGQLMVTLLGE